MPSATRSSASFQDAGRSGLVRSPGTVRTSGVSSRSLWSSRFAAVHPLEHSPPLLVGKSSCGCRVAGQSPATIKTPHCSEQYGQWVAVGTARAAALTFVSVEARCFGGPRAVLRADCVVLTNAGQGCARNVINRRRKAQRCRNRGLGIYIIAVAPINRRPEK